MSANPHIDRNRAALLSLMAKVCVAAGIWEWVLGTGAAGTVPRYVRDNVARILLPMESAIRRLIVVAARGLEVPLPASGAPLRGTRRAGPGGRFPGFPLIDRCKRFESRPRPCPVWREPRILTIGCDEFTPRQRPPLRLSDDPVEAERLCRRIRAMRRALDNIPAQARRLARWRRAHALRRPLRPGRPPGFRAKSRRAVDEILDNCHALALYALRPPDSS